MQIYCPGNHILIDTCIPVLKLAGCQNVVASQICRLDIFFAIELNSRIIYQCFSQVPFDFNAIL